MNVVRDVVRATDEFALPPPSFDDVERADELASLKKTSQLVRFVAAGVVARWRGQPFTAVEEEQYLAACAELDHRVPRRRP